jgi:hypothetical protein
LSRFQEEVFGKTFLRAFATAQAPAGLGAFKADPDLSYKDFLSN